MVILDALIHDGHNNAGITLFKFPRFGKVDVAIRSAPRLAGVMIVPLQREKRIIGQPFAFRPGAGRFQPGLYQQLNGSNLIESGIKSCQPSQILICSDSKIVPEVQPPFPVTRFMGFIAKGDEKGLFCPFNAHSLV